jgi:error-prone DNA polymerase
VFPHLHVASWYSLRYGASSPERLVRTAAGHGMDTLALTDRDGLYGAVKFVLAARRAGVAPVLGADLAVGPTGVLAGRPEPRGRSPRARITVLALGAGAGGALGAGVGWGLLCRLVSAAHARGQRGRPVTTAEMVAAHSAPAPGGPPALAVLLGPWSEAGWAALACRPDLAQAVVRRWQVMLPPGSVAVEIVCHHVPGRRPASVGHAARMLAVARACGVPAVLTNAVRYATPDDAATIGVLDAVRRRTSLDGPRLDGLRVEADLAPPSRIAAVAREVASAAGAEGEEAVMLADTRALAGRCRLDPSSDLGIGSVHLPEPRVLGLGPGHSAEEVLRRRCEGGIGRRYPGAVGARLREVTARLDGELAVIGRLGYASYFLTVELVCSLIRDDLGIRAAARGSGAGSLVNYLLGISGVDPLRHDLVMERFLSPLRAQLPDIDIDVESARRQQVYERVLDRFGAARVACVSTMDTYRARHAIRDVGAALGLSRGEAGAIAASFPHLRARDVRRALGELPELGARGLAGEGSGLLLDLVERLDGLPRHVAQHPCGVILSHAGLLDRTPVETSWLGFPLSQFDKDDVEDLGLLKLDVLGIRMQSAMAHALDEISRVDGADAARAGGHPRAATYLDPRTGRIDLDAVPHDDEATFELIRTTRTLGMFQIESPGQRELVGKLAPKTFDDLIVDISLFRPGPVKSGMIARYLRVRHGRAEPEHLHPHVRRALAGTGGVVVFHEQVLRVISTLTGCTLAEADEARRALGTQEGQEEVEGWLRASAAARGYDTATVTRIWQVLASFGSFGFCKAHAAAFAVPTYHSAWLKTHHPAAFLAGVLTHDPGMYPKRLILDDARRLGVTILPLDVNRSDGAYRVEKVDPLRGSPPVLRAAPRLPDGRGYGIRLSLADLKGIRDPEIDRIVAGRPYRSLADFWHRAAVSRPVVERLIVTGAFDSLDRGGSRPGGDCRRDLLLQAADLDRRPRAAPGGHHAAQLALDLGDAAEGTVRGRLPPMTGAERARAELDALGLDASRHVIDFYVPLLDALGVTRAEDVLGLRGGAEVLLAGAKVATHTPWTSSGRRVVFLTLDDATGPVDIVFFEEAARSCAATVLHTWLLVVRGVPRRTGARGVSVRATGAWALPALWDTWTSGGTEAVRAVVASAGAGRPRHGPPRGPRHSGWGSRGR